MSYSSVKHGEVTHKEATEIARKGFKANLESDRLQGRKKELGVAEARRTAPFRS